MIIMIVIQTWFNIFSLYWYKQTCSYTHLLISAFITTITDTSTWMLLLVPIIIINHFVIFLYVLVSELIPISILWCSYLMPCIIIFSICKVLLIWSDAMLIFVRWSQFHVLL
jgi:hypothetical protein